MAKTYTYTSIYVRTYMWYYKHSHCPKPCHFFSPEISPYRHQFSTGWARLCLLVAPLNNLFSSSSSPLHRKYLHAVNKSFLSELPTPPHPLLSRRFKLRVSLCIRPLHEERPRPLSFLPLPPPNKCMIVPMCTKYTVPN